MKRMHPARLTDRIEGIAALDAVEQPMRALAGALERRPKLEDALHGTWLGHPLHPALTDLPIGFYTTAWCCDLIPNRRLQRLSDAMLVLGLAASMPTIASGVADWADLDPPVRRTATVHALFQLAANVYYLRALSARIRGHRAKGIRLAMIGATVMTAGAYLGGHLVARRGVGVDRNATTDRGPEDWMPVIDETSVMDGEPVAVLAGGVRVLVVRTGDRICAIGDTCSHAGGPLHEGVLDHAGCVRCPWHGSTFRLADGAVIHGPATFAQPDFDVRVADGKIEIRRRP